MPQKKIQRKCNNKNMMHKCAFTFLPGHTNLQKVNAKKTFFLYFFQLIFYSFEAVMCMFVRPHMNGRQKKFQHETKFLVCPHLMSEQTKRENNIKRCVCEQNLGDIQLMTSWTAVVKDALTTTTKIVIINCFCDNQIDVQSLYSDLSFSSKLTEPKIQLIIKRLAQLVENWKKTNN